MNLKAAIAILLGVTASIGAQAETRYILTITNGGNMPISPGVVLVKDGQEAASAIGQAPTAGFIQLCQTGNPMTRAQELSANMKVKSVVQTTAPILPGESLDIEVATGNPVQESIQFEAMYGKTKDVCAAGYFGSHALTALKQHVTSDVISKDNVISTGAFLDPAIPEGLSYLDTRVCAQAADAVTCLRELSLPNPAPAKIRFFSGYFSSLNMLLETKYGATDAKSLQVPDSGAVQFKLKLKH